MRRVVATFAFSLALAGAVVIGRPLLDTAAQDATPAPTTDHDIVGTWIVDTISAADTDPPEIGIFTGDGTGSGLGANRVAGFTWEVVDERTVLLTGVTVADQGGVGSYVVIRGVHVLDDSGDAWTCECTFTVVGADGTVLDSGQAPASARRLPVEGSDQVGSALDVVPTWSPMQLEASPTS